MYQKFNSKKLFALTVNIIRVQNLYYTIRSNKTKKSDFAYVIEKTN